MILLANNITKKEKQTERWGIRVQNCLNHGTNWSLTHTKKKKNLSKETPRDTPRIKCPTNSNCKRKPTKSHWKNLGTTRPQC